MTNENLNQTTLSPQMTEASVERPRGVHLVGSVPLPRQRQYFAQLAQFWVNDYAVFLMGRQVYAQIGLAGK